MSIVTPRIGLRVWDDINDGYNHEQLADNWAKVDDHDHTPGKGKPLPAEAFGGLTIGNAQLEDDSVDASKIADGSITEDHLDSSVLDLIDLADTKTLILKSDSVSTQALTTGFVTQKQGDGVTDSSITPENGKTYVIDATFVASKASDTTNASREANFEVRAGATVLARSLPGGGGDDGELTIESTSPDRAILTGIGSFVSDGTAVKLYVKAGSTTDTPQLERKDTRVFLREVMV